MSKRGRHSGDDPRTRRIMMRVTEAEYMDVETYAREHNMTITMTLLKAFEEMKQKKT